MYCQKTLHILTATQRLARQYRKNLLSDSTYIDANILSISEWEQETFAHFQVLGYIPPVRVLSDYEEDKLWNHVIEQQMSSAPLRDNEQLVREIKSAVKICHYWNIKDNELALYQNDVETSQYLKLTEKFDECCVIQGVISQAGRAKYLDQHRDKIHNIFTNVKIVGLDHIPPIISGWFPEAEFDHQFDASADTYSCEYDTQEEEVRSAAHWAKREIERDPALTLGIFVPNLNEDRNLILRLFDHVFMENMPIQLGRKVEKPFSISGGVPISSVPIIEHALKLISFSVQRSISRVDFLEILLSPYFTCLESIDDFPSVKKAIYGLRKSQITHRDLQYLVQYKNIVALEPITSILSKKMVFKTYLAGLEAIEDLLKSGGWPGKRVPDSQEFQALMQFQTIKTKAPVLHRGEVLNPSEFLYWLKYETNKIVFQEKSPLARVHILGLLESSGIQFDKILVLGAHHKTWPASPKLNVFLPPELQKKYETPMCSYEHELTMSIRYIKRIRSQANSVYFSTYLKNKESTFRLSPLLSTFPKIQMPKYDYKDREQARIKKIQIPDKLAGERGIKGGTYGLKAFSDCPFKYFSKQVLDIKEVREDKEYFSALDRGNILHNALCELWRWIRNSNHLSQTSTEQIYKFVSNTLDGLFKRHKTLYENKVLIEHETERLVFLILKLVEVERQREPFEVMATELLAKIKVNNHEYSVIIDRVDRLENGQLLIIDYKTGKASPAMWTGQRPKEPQMPLYSFYSDHIAGLTYILISPDQVVFKGLADPAINLLGVKHAVFSEYKQEWLLSLSDLETRLESGCIEVDPRDMAACQHCEYHALCRVSEKNNG